jgi:hypothetical protein
MTYAILQGTAIPEQSRYSPWQQCRHTAYALLDACIIHHCIDGGRVVQAYGTTTYLVTSLKQVPRGTEGAVSLEGSLAGFLAAAAFSLCGAPAYEV